MFADCRACDARTNPHFNARLVGRCPTCPRETHYQRYRKACAKTLAHRLGIRPDDPREVERIIDDSEALLAALTGALRDADWKIPVDWDPEFAALAEIALAERDRIDRIANWVPPK